MNLQKINKDMTTTMNNTDWNDWLFQITAGTNSNTGMPSGSFEYQGYTITPVINDNPYLFHNWDAVPANSPKRKVGKTVYLVTLQGYADETYFKNLQAAKKFIRNCNNR
jgi:hypothetical protein